jgi:DNA-binding phage protein
MTTKSNLIRARTASVGLNISSLAKRTGICRQTLYDRLRDPDRLTLAELRALDRQIHFTDEELVILARRKE